MSINECNKLHQQITRKINSWPAENSNTLINNISNNISNNFSYISNNFSYNLSSISANFSNSIGSNGSIKSNSTSLSEQTRSNKTGKLSSSNSLATINANGSNGISNGRLQPSSIALSSSNISNGKLSVSSEQETVANVNKSPKSNGTFNSVFYTAAPPSSLNQSSNSSLVQITNTKLDEELIDLIGKLNQKCEFLNKYGTKHDYTGKQVNGYFSMLRIVQSFFEYVANQMDKKRRKVFPDLIEVANLLLLILNAMEDYAKKYSELRVRYDNNDYNLDLLTDYEDEDDVKKKTENRKDAEQNGSDISSNESEDELDEVNNFENISSNLVRMSSHLANSIESMKSQCENVFDDLVNNNETFDPEEEDDEGEKDKIDEKIEDYYRNNNLDNEDDKEFGKEIKKEEYESTIQKYYKRFNFNFKLSKSSSCTSPVNEDGSPKKIQQQPAIALNGQRPDSPKKIKSEKKYYKYFSSLKTNFEENFSKLTNNSNSEPNFNKGISDDQATNNSNSPKNGKLPNSSSSNALKKEAIQDGAFLVEDPYEQEEYQETEEEKRLRNAKLDEYILSKFAITNDPEHLVTPPMLYFYEGFTLTLNCEKELSLVYGRVGPFWYCKSAAQVVNLVRNVVVILTSPPNKSIASLMNTDYCSRLFAHRQVNATLDSLLQGLATLEVKAYNRRYFKYLYREHVIYGKTIKLPVHSEFELPDEGNELIRHKVHKATKSNENLNEIKEETNVNGKTEESSGKKLSNGSENNSQEDNEEEVVLDAGFNSRTVRCRLINYVRSQNETEICENSHKCLLYHVHGGGFVLSSPDSHELYLRDWAVKLKGIPILSVDYTLRQRYPKAPQDVLDVYMYLVDPKNQQSVSELIGFQPEKIVIAGDSAGANLVFSLVCCLNEIRRNNPEYANIKMPTSIVCIYGAFDIRAVISPSKFISGIDPILHHGNIMAMIGTYAGIGQKIRKTIWSRIKNKRSIAWYRVSERELMQRFKTLSKAMESYFASPLNYPRLEDLKDISLHLISTHFCPLIDDSVVLYKAWRGASTFDVFDGLPHAFLNFCDRSEEAKIATDRCAERIIQAFAKAPKKSQSDQKNKTSS